MAAAMRSSWAFSFPGEPSPVLSQHLWANALAPNIFVTSSKLAPVYKRHSCIGETKIGWYCSRFRVISAEPGWINTSVSVLTMLLLIQPAAAARHTAGSRSGCYLPTPPGPFQQSGSPSSFTSVCACLPFPAFLYVEAVNTNIWGMAF